jgi:dephospho-CoA kinase
VLRIGLTGNVASGKSTLASTWAGRGAALIDADVLARRAVAPGSEGLERVRSAFGEGVVAHGELDRAALRRIVFADPAARHRLEAIVHPEVARLREEEEAKVAAAGAGIVVHDIPLLFEAGLDDAFDLIVVVHSPEETRAERMAEMRGLSHQEIKGLLASQLPPEEVLPRADMAVENDGTLEDLVAEADLLWRRVLRPLTGQRVASVRQGAACRVDMHVHTRLSHDSLSRPESVVARALARGLARVCITDHNEVEAALDLARRFPNRVIPGEEVKTKEGVDVIGLYIQEWIPKGTPARETCHRIREQGGLVYMPHPFAGGKGGGGRILEEVQPLVHVVEGFNARIHQPALNRRAQEWAAERGLPTGAGSDAHTLGEIGNAWVEVPAFTNDPGSFLSALTQGRIYGREASRAVHLASTFAKLFP